MSLNSFGEKRFFRFKYRAQPGKSEKQVAEENGVFKVYGCGHNIYIMKLWYIAALISEEMKIF